MYEPTNKPTSQVRHGSLYTINQYIKSLDNGTRAKYQIDRLIKQEGNYEDYVANIARARSLPSTYFRYILPVFFLATILISILTHIDIASAFTFVVFGTFFGSAGITHLWEELLNRRHKSYQPANLPYRLIFSCEPDPSQIDIEHRQEKFHLDPITGELLTQAISDEKTRELASNVLARYREHSLNLDHYFDSREIDKLQELIRLASEYELLNQTERQKLHHDLAQKLGQSPLQTDSELHRSQS